MVSGLLASQLGERGLEQRTRGKDEDTSFYGGDSNPIVVSGLLASRIGERGLGRRTTGNGGSEKLALRSLLLPSFTRLKEWGG